MRDSLQYTIIAYPRNVLDTLDEDLDSRLISFLNEAPVNDGGQWDMAVNLIGELLQRMTLLVLPPHRPGRVFP